MITRKDMPRKGRCWWILKVGEAGADGSPPIHNDELCGAHVGYKDDPEEGRRYKNLCDRHQAQSDAMPDTEEEEA